MGGVVDLVAVRDARAELARLATVHPELCGERGAGNVEGWILTLKGDEMQAKTCKQCGKPFIAQRNTAEFHDDKCRAAWNRRQSVLEVSPLTDALTRAAELSGSYDASKGCSDEKEIKKTRDQALRDARAAIDAELHLATIDPPEASTVRAPRARFDAADPESLRAEVKAVLNRGEQSQRAFALGCGIDPADLSRFMTGKRILPDEKRALIAAALANA